MWLKTTQYSRAVDQGDLTWHDYKEEQWQDQKENCKSKHITENATPAKSFPGLVTSQGAGNSQIKVLETETMPYREKLWTLHSGWLFCRKGDTAWSFYTTIFVGCSSSLSKQKKVIEWRKRHKGGCEDDHIAEQTSKADSVSLCPEWLLDITVEGGAANVHAECNLGTTPDASIDSGFE